MNRWQFHHFGALRTFGRAAPSLKTRAYTHEFLSSGIFDELKTPISRSKMPSNFGVSLPRNTTKIENRDFFDRSVRRQNPKNRLFGKKNDYSRKKEFGGEEWWHLTLKEVE